MIEHECCFNENNNCLYCGKSSEQYWQEQADETMRRANSGTKNH